MAGALVVAAELSATGIVTAPALLAAGGNSVSSNVVLLVLACASRDVDCSTGCSAGAVASADDVLVEATGDSSVTMRPASRGSSVSIVDDRWL